MNTHARKSLTGMVLFGALLVLAVHLAAGTAAMAKVADSTSIMGIVAVTDAGYVIIGESEDYLVVGFDLSGMINMTVKATGIISESDGIKEIRATSVEPL